MGLRSRIRIGIRSRDLIAVVVLVGQLFGSLGFPLPSRAASKPGGSSQPFPCQNHPCGCQTADRCWEGDCCCFTLEQKLAWADANGIDPPDHVRPQVEARKAQIASQKKKPTCCEKATPDCPHCKLEAAKEKPAVRWVSAMHAQKCRGEGFVGLFQSEPSVPPTPITERLTSREPVAVIAIVNALPTSSSQRPPIPPPRPF